MAELAVDGFAYGCNMTTDNVIQRLFSISTQVEEHRAMIYNLEIERAELQAELRVAGWKPGATNAEPRSD